ncbi:TPA: hypothetical protein U1W61_000678 [Streptococcus suis]|uniref:hypothetical protein n=1 Tax=Streptococcus suis TaxID=1307 RepID=UPI000CF3810C|nr:hypothetical protein [Streptococcus suis]NQI71265.1 hypothetical protein [Streptococcus suis]HEM4128983.1 hypothetical protein [Streptococcus suis]
MDKVIKTPNYLRSMLIGASALVLPTFFQNQDIPKVEVDKLTAGQRVQLDYSRSLKEIKEEAVKFGYKAK